MVVQDDDHSARMKRIHRILYGSLPILKSYSESDEEQEKEEADIESDEEYDDEESNDGIINS